MRLPCAPQSNSAEAVACLPSKKNTVTSNSMSWEYSERIVDKGENRFADANADDTVVELKRG